MSGRVDGRASGAKVNIEKSEIMYVGTDREDEDRFERDYFRVLGVNLGIEDRESRDVQFEGIVNSSRKMLGFLKN